MADVGIFGFQKTSFSGSWKYLVRTSDRKTVVSDSDYFFVRIYDTCSYLCARILASLCREERYAHKIFISSKVVSPFAYFFSHAFDCK